ncbi:probable serine/threonine-protein kinase clkA [Uloborus diversus]|uniref:probable serine/threonine-protein kinase clkA n=1 Tax=Uloborus diversus TaxID=327109 RepID=UPI00240908EF|nr:probable serine/threonine-protein kinase clkA [Uloborus diversus]
MTVSPPARAAKEHLTSQNRPSGECAICLYGFSEQDIFTRTECYHYFHSHCLARYVKNILENAEESEEKDVDKSSELFCPMCRIPIKFSTSDEEYPPPTAINEETFNLTEEIVDLQKKMADLYQKQLEKGGIIDVEAERNKYLLEISDMPTQSTSVEKSDSKVVEQSSLDESSNAEPDAHQSPKDKAVVNEKNTKSSSKENFQGNSGRRKKFDPKYERKPDRYERRPDAYRQNNYGKYHRHRDGQFKNASSRTASQEHYSKKDAVQIDSEDQQPTEESTSEVNDPVNKNSDSPDSVKPKHTNNSDYRYNYNRNPRFNQRGRYQRYNNYSNNGSYNRDRRYDGSNNYYKFNYHNRKPHQSNDHFEEKFQDDVDKEGTQRSRGRYYKEKSSFDHKDQFQEDGDTEDTQRSRGRYYKEKSNFDHRDQFQEDGDKEDTQRSRGRYYKEKSNYDRKDRFQDDDKEDTQRSGGRHFKERSNYDRKDKFQNDVDKEDTQRSGGRYFKERNNYDHKFQHKNEKANDSDQNSSEKYSSNANQRKEQHVRKNDLPSERTPQKNDGGDCSENIASDDLYKTEVENSQENKLNPMRSKNYSNYNSSHNYGNDTQYHDKYDYNNRSSRYQRNPNKSYNYGHYSPQNGGYKNYGSEKWQNRPYQKKSSEDFKQEAVAKESESQIKKPVVERNVESSLAPNRSGAEKSSISEMTPGGSPSMLRPPPGFANPASRVHYGLKAANPPPGFSKS